MLIYKGFFKNTKMGKMLLRIGFAKRLIFPLFSNVIRCNTEVKNYFMVINIIFKSIHWRKNTYGELRLKGHNIHREFLETYRDSRWLNLMPGWLLLNNNVWYGSMARNNDLLKGTFQRFIWNKVFKSGLSKFCRRQPLKNLLSPLLNTLSHLLLTNP